MSIVTLKRKTAAKNNISHSSTGFSLNGGHRSQGYVGQTSLSRSLPRTLMKGDTAKGHGGCCGKYNTTPIVTSAVLTTEDPTVIKMSSITNKGMLATHYRWVLRPQPFSVCKPDNNLHKKTQQQYIENLHRKSLIDMTGPCAITTKRVNVKCPQLSNPTASENVQNPTRTCFDTFAPDPAKHRYLMSSEYTETMAKPCVQDDVFFVSTESAHVPFACNQVQ